jgi:hypothetical protein
LLPRIGVSDVLLWQQYGWQCLLSFTGPEARLRLYLREQLISDQAVTEGLSALEQADAWRLAIQQAYRLTRA